MKIALFGGSFDPPHLGHARMIRAVLEQDLFDEVWFLPVFEHQPRFDKDKMSNWQHRVAMLSLMQNAKCKISKFEKESGQKSYTHLALRELSKQYPEHKFSWLMGSDQLSSLEYWKCNLHEQCFPMCSNEFDYYVYHRSGFAMNLPYKNLKVIKNVEPMKISSTKIRNLVKAKKSISGLVSSEVERYIKENNLYK